ncbi:hypothetical protein CHLRE_01g033350v5 [Chlamydomonas reinhardtii]|uniref:Aldehyde dehydrogenase domain-containing protein n=1 Tax=Chlamydomonas reinhardtii TaxID=3055 RepID=A0A2K3E6W5_CHLRE|nr:uncharacterized protein CHLRE_01g033350v5 [Chlamydomonas reinhardtii]PNW88530.1 hypothetical protein CHLRE_01g033350v5 [Chlamydomonas reinhardtii]
MAVVATAQALLKEGVAKLVQLSGFSETQLVQLAVVAVIALGLVLLLNNVVATLRIPSIKVELTEAEANDIISAPKYTPGQPVDKDVVPCYDPSTMQLLGHLPAMSASEVRSRIARCKAAQKEWRTSSFAQRRKLLRILLKFIIENVETICRVSARDSGKPMLDAILGEVVVTCEKIHWLSREGEAVLRPERRSAGILSFYKSARVEFHPVGVVGAIVPWNYPFHNVLNPLTAALFAGDGLVIKVSEHASWSTGYYGRMISAALAAAGAPADLVQIVTGYGEAGSALVTGGVDKVIFVGSTQVGKMVMRAAADTLTPVVLELGGKDAVIVTEDADLDNLVQVVLKAAFLNCGQNCAGGERFFVHEKIYDKFLERLTPLVAGLRQGNPLGDAPVDCGAMCMPGLAEKVHGLVTEAVSRGARLLAGGVLVPSGERGGQFYPPTLLADVRPGMKIWEEEVFGPVMSVIKWSTDDEVVALANDCDFGLGSNVFAGSQARARSIASRLEAGMSSINDFATTYMCQSLPFGGVKHSGFDRFAGVEGLRGLCVPKAVAEDRFPLLMRSSIPPAWQLPLPPHAVAFGVSLVTMFYGPGLLYQARGLASLLHCLVFPGAYAKKKQGQQQAARAGKAKST